MYSSPRAKRLPSILSTPTVERLIVNARGWKAKAQLSGSSWPQHWSPNCLLRMHAGACVHLYPFTPTKPVWYRNTTLVQSAGCLAWRHLMHFYWNDLRMWPIFDVIFWLSLPVHKLDVCIINLHIMSSRLWPAEDNFWRSVYTGVGQQLCCIASFQHIHCVDFVVHLNMSPPPPHPSTHT